MRDFMSKNGVDIDGMLKGTIKRAVFEVRSFSRKGTML